jgi:uncharacterized protein YbbK (DUF523 family)
MASITVKISVPVKKVISRTKLKIGVSSCLLGQPVRYNGDHKYNQTVVDLLGDQFEAVPVCPEVEMGMGVPREQVQVVEGRLVGVESGKDWTDAMNSFNSNKLEELAQLNLSGFIFKVRSPSCGTGRVPLHQEQSGEKSSSSGLFARAFMKHFPLIPVIDEEALQDKPTREKFIARIIEAENLRR